MPRRESTHSVEFVNSTERRTGMAISELDQKIVATEGINGARPSLRVAVSAETSASPEQVLAAARDFSERRAQIWRNVSTKRLEVHERGDGWAEVTEGTMIVGVFWERCHYDWSQPATVTATVRSSSVFRPGSRFELRAIPRDGGGSEVEMVVSRDFRHGPKGTIARSVNHLGGRRLFGWYLRSTLAAIEKTLSDERKTS